MKVVIKTKDNKHKTIINNFNKDNQKVFLDIVKIHKQFKKPFEVSYE